MQIMQLNLKRKITMMQWMLNNNNDKDNTIVTTFVSSSYLLYTN